ncbi:EamA family transporter [Saccharomonospora cyanea]|uniref:EamA family transporter n=1 Tax=Saccharomonospora cyanea TaxID=40989 RepID=UPI0003017442|nr:EamA family transporter [Saccharomonospora cyanea]
MAVPPHLLVLGAAVSVQTGQAWGKLLFTEAGPLGVVALRLASAALILLALHRPALPRGRDLAFVCALGAAIAGMNLVYPALRWLPVGVASTIQLLGPLAVAVCTSRRAADLVFAGVAVLGVLLVRDSSAGALPWQGLVLAVASAASMAAYLLLSRRVGRDTAGLGGLAWAVTVAAVLGVPAGLVHSGDAVLAPDLLAVGVALGLTSAVIPYSLEMAALRRLAPRIVAVLQCGEPVVAALAGLVLLDELLTPTQLVGVGCVIIAATAVTLRSREQDVPPEGETVPRQEGGRPRHSR